jgi:hypothetical protein
VSGAWDACQALAARLDDQFPLLADRAATDDETRAVALRRGSTAPVQKPVTQKPSQTQSADNQFNRYLTAVSGRTSIISSQ